MGRRCNDRGKVIPGLHHQDLFQMVHSRGDGDINVLRAAPAATQINGPASDEGVRDLIRLEEHGYEARREAQLQQVGGVGRIVELREAVRVVNLSHRERGKIIEWRRCEVLLARAGRSSASGLPSFDVARRGEEADDTIPAASPPRQTPVGEDEMSSVM